MAKRFGRSLSVLAMLVIVPLVPGQTAGSVPAAPERKAVVVLGDSLAAGLGVEQEQAFPALLQKKIDAVGWNFSVVNAGVSGDTSAGGLARIDWLLRRKVSVLILELGGNDGLRGIPVSATKKNLQAILD
jgi:acyl-CoA thioesterase-1